MRALLYARVSSDRQEHEETIQSQLAELRVRSNEDDLAECPEFLDEGYSRDNLVRPGLDRVRDLAAASDLDRLYVQCPDRLASGAKLIILVEEFQQRGVEVVFLKGAADDTPEGKLLLHMQGAIVEYERTKIAERTRRGKLYWARQGAVVSGHSPYGYRFVRRSDTARAGLEVDEAQAAVVRDIYRWLLDEELSTRAIARRLTDLHVPTAAGARQWHPTVVHRILCNPVNHGAFQYHKFERVVSQHRRSPDIYRQQLKNGRRLRPVEEWITIPVPAIVDRDQWERAQAQLRKNLAVSPRNNTRHDYLLRGLVRCPSCGASCNGHFRYEKRYYRCSRNDAALSSTGQNCHQGSLLAEPLEQAVWEAVTEAFQREEALVAEYRRRLAQASSADGIESERKQLALAQKKVKAQEDRLTDAYLNEAIEVDRYKAEMATLKHRRAALEQSGKDMERRRREAEDDRRAVEHISAFCGRVSQGLENLTFEERQKLLRLVVERITVENGLVRIETIIPLGDDPVLLRTHHSERSEGSLPIRTGDTSLDARYGSLAEAAALVFATRHEPPQCVFQRPATVWTSKMSMSPSLSRSKRGS